jgi:hypothetical protein
MSNLDKARAHSTDAKLTRAVVAMLDTLGKHYPELEALPDSKVVALEVRLEAAVRTAFDIREAERQGAKHGDQ